MDFPEIGADIRPGKTLGGVCIGQPIKAYPQLLSLVSDTGTYRMHGPLVASYLFQGQAVEVTVDISTGLIAKVTASTGYRGVLWGVIRVGTACEELFRKFSDAEYLEEECLIVFREVEGLALNIDKDDPNPDDVLDARVSHITVFSPNLVENSGWSQRQVSELGTGLNPS